MLLFSIFHIYVSHQHVQMITGPHEKSCVEKFFGDLFLTKFTFSGAMRWSNFSSTNLSFLHDFFLPSRHLFFPVQQ